MAQSLASHIALAGIYKVSMQYTSLCMLLRAADACSTTNLSQSSHVNQVCRVGPITLASLCSIKLQGHPVLQQQFNFRVVCFEVQLKLEFLGKMAFWFAGAGEILLDVLSLLNPTGGAECGASSLLLLGPPGVGNISYTVAGILAILLTY